MFEDEMIENELTRSSEEYYRISASGCRAEQVTAARLYISALEAAICMFKNRSRAQVAALLTF